jgi:glycosyltransferase involved in cell wall biosynthesis
VAPDDVESLAKGILEVATNAELAEALSDSGFSKVRKLYSVARMADRALEAYEAVIHGPARQYREISSLPKTDEEVCAQG